jgi:hypothetical protein
MVLFLIIPEYILRTLLYSDQTGHEIMSAIHRRVRRQMENQTYDVWARNNLLTPRNCSRIGLQQPFLVIFHLYTKGLDASVSIIPFWR